MRKIKNIFTARLLKRIDFDPLDKGDGILFADAVQYNFKDGKIANSHPLIHSLLMLGIT